MTSMRHLLMLLFAAALLAAGCGGGENLTGPAARTQSAAALAPADSAGYVGVDTNLDSTQWGHLEVLLDRFPDGDRLIDWLVDELDDEGASWEQDVQPALGPVSAVVLRGREPVVLVQPEDRAALDALLAKADARQVTADLEDGWVAIARTQAQLDAFRSAAERGRLDADSAFREAMAGLPEDSLASVYLTGEALGTGMTPARRSSQGFR